MVYAALETSFPPLKYVNAGAISASKRAMMPTTTSSSINVKPRMLSGSRCFGSVNPPTSRSRGTTARREATARRRALARSRCDSGEHARGRCALTPIRPVMLGATSEGRNIARIRQMTSSDLGETFWGCVINRLEIKRQSKLFGFWPIWKKSRDCISAVATKKRFASSSSLD